MNVKTHAKYERIIKSIHVEMSNFQHIADTGSINGTLYTEIKRILHEQEQERDTFAAGFLKWYRNNAIPSETGHLSSEQLLEQYKATLK
jgi:hypothetical protein